MTPEQAFDEFQRLRAEKLSTLPRGETRISLEIDESLAINLLRYLRTLSPGVRHRMDRLLKDYRKGGVKRKYVLDAIQSMDLAGVAFRIKGYDA